ncbi:MAG: 2-hydroxyacyl-CoA dehydratase, partial [Proteobacteria bacterium]|nr:2-hydroxyacyl-CoA dehydratase [Pseudomonadota bacterium]
FRAFGFHPMEVWGPPKVDPVDGNIHFQAYTCGIVRHATSFILQGGLDEVEVLLVPHTCDALQGMGSAAKDFLELKQSVQTIYHPRQTRDCDLDFYVDEIRRLGEELGKISGLQPSDADLHRAVEVEEKADALLAELARGRSKISLSDREFYTLLRSREYLFTEEWIELAEKAPRGPAPTKGVPLMISGIVVEPMSLFDDINGMGAHIVADDLAGCSRRAYGAYPDEKDPYRRMAKRLLYGPFDPSRGSPIPERCAGLANQMLAVGARGMLLYDVKFCEPELFDVPQLRLHLEQRNLKLLHIEFDLADGLSQQTLTRIEAFVETLQ